MLLPSTSSPFLRILTSDLNRLAVWTNLAAARAWSPRRLRMASLALDHGILFLRDDDRGGRRARGATSSASRSEAT